MVIPTYLRTHDDLTGPVNRTGSGFELVEVVNATAPDPAFAGYQSDGDADRYAAAAVAALRAWSEPSLAAAVERRPAADRAATLDALYACIGARLAAQPTPCTWTITLLRVRRRS
jgi:hypothetical protein